MSLPKRDEVQVLIFVVFVAFIIFEAITVTLLIRKLTTDLMPQEFPI